MIVYKITNKLNGHVYIGQTRQSLRKRWQGHQYPNGCRVLYRAIKKYGKENFSIEVLGQYSTQEALNAAEKCYIVLYNCLAPQGYNLTTGGDQNYTVSQETRQKRTIALKGRKLSSEHKKKLSIAHKGKDNKCKGRVYSIESRTKMSNSHKGVKLSLEHRQKLGRKGKCHHYFGKVRNEETKTKISLSLKAYFKKKGRK